MLTLIAAPFIFFVCFLVQQKVQQHHMLEKLENASLQNISINKADLVWVKKNKEVLIDGKLFDVKSYSTINDKIILTGLFDKDEDAIKKNYANKLRSNKNESTPVSELVLKCMFAFTVNESTSDDEIYILDNFEDKKYFLFSQKNIPQYISVHTPPPNA
jgi:hypothetical protein